MNKPFVIRKSLCAAAMAILAWSAPSSAENSARSAALKAGPRDTIAIERRKPELLASLQAIGPTPANKAKECKVVFYAGPQNNIPICKRR